MQSMSPWVYDPQSGGIKIPSHFHKVLGQQAETLTQTRPWYPRIQLKLRFKNQFVLLDGLHAIQRECKRYVRIEARHHAGKKT